MCASLDIAGDLFGGIAMPLELPFGGRFLFEFGNDSYGVGRRASGAGAFEGVGKVFCRLAIFELFLDVGEGECSFALGDFMLFGC